MTYTSKDWPKIISNHLKNKLGDQIGNQIMSKIADKLGFDWDSVSSFTYLGKIVTGTNVLAWVVAALLGILNNIRLAFSMPAIQSNEAIERTGRVWFDDPPKNPYDPNKFQDQYVEFLVYSWIYSYLTTGFKYGEPIYEF